MLHHLNLAQRDIFFDRTLNPDRLYLVGGEMQVDGAFDDRAAAAAYRAVMRDVAAMRARLVLQDHQPMLAVAPPDDASHVPVRLEDFCTDAEPGMSVAARAAALWAEPIRPEDGRVMHDMWILKAAHDRRTILFRCHHLIVDGWAGLALFDRFRRAYDMILAGGTPPPDPAPLPDPAAEHAWIQGPKAAEDSAFWARELGDLPARAFLRRPPFGPSLKARITRDRAAFARIEAVAAAAGIPLPALLLTLFATLVHELTGRAAMIVATPVRNRMTAAERAAIAPFVRLMPLGLQIDPAGRLGEAAAAVQAAMRRGFRHQRLPMGAIGKALGRRPGAGDAMLGDVLFSFETRPATQGFAGCRTLLHPVSHEGDKYALALHVRDLGGEGPVDFDLALDAAHWGPLGAAPVVDRLRPMLEALERATPDTPLAQLIPPMPAAERALIARVNDTARPLPGRAGGAASVVELIRDTARLRSADPALVTAAGEVTSFAALDLWSDRVARALIACGAGPGRIVGVMIDRRPAMIAAVLGVLKSGAAFLPLDPALPAARLAELAADGGAITVITCRDFATIATGRPLLVMDDAGALDAPEVALPAPAPDHLAYLLYTSGTTGRPKGVMVDHAALLNRLVWQWHALGHRHHEPILHRTTASFDVSVWEMLMPPAMGAPMVLCPAVTAHDPQALARLIEARGVACLHFVPGALDAMLAGLPATDDERLSRLRLIVTSGEALRAETVRRVAARWPGVRIVNLYGPTEAAIDVARHDADPEETVVPIGRPVWNTQLLVVDPDTLQPVAVGRPGELVIGGVQLARGYLGRPELSAERFPEDPASPGARLYRTGDEALLTPDGVFLYLGRRDDQVKIDGARVEPGEVAARLAGHPAVQEAAVRAIAGPRGPRLAGWYVGEGVSPAELRSWAAGRLPGWMVPAVLTRLDQLPRRPNGKLDAAALPAPDLAEGPVRTAPATALEAAIAGAFARVLDGVTVDAATDFFLAGGHSLTALRLTGEIRAATGLETDLKQLFLNPTPRLLAAALDQARIAAGDHEDEGPLPLFRPATGRPATGRTAPVFLIPPVAGEPAIFLDLAARLGQTAWGLRFPAHPAAGLPEFARHLARTVLEIAPGGPWRLIGYSLGGMAAFDAARLIEAETGGRVDLVLLDTSAEPVPMHPDAVAAKFDREFARAAADGTDAMGRLAAGLGRPAVARLKARVLRNARATTGWRARGVIHGDITMITARRDPAERRPERWAAHTTGRFRLIELDAGHFDLLSDRMMPDLVRALAPAPEPVPA